MNRWIAIRASSALAIAGGLASLAASAALAAGLLLLTPRYPGPLPPRLLFVGGVLSCIVFGALAVWSLWTGVAVLGRRPWARQSMITLGGTIAMFGATGTLSSAFTPLGTVTSADEQLARMVRISLALLFGVMAATGVCWIALFNSAFAKRYFSSEARDTEPLSIAVIGWYLTIAGSAGALGAILHAPALVFGWVATSWSAYAVNSVFAAAQIALSAGLVGREPAARSWAIVYFCALAANSFSTMAFPNAMRELQLQAASFLHIGLAEEVSAPGLAAAMIAGAAALVPVWFLARKNAFRRPPSAVRQ